MISLKYFFTKVKDIKCRDLLAVFPMGIALIVSPLYRKKYKNTWLICEERKEARDNGYWFTEKCVKTIQNRNVYML